VSNLVPADNGNDSSATKSLNISKEDYDMLLDMLRKAKPSHAEPSINQLSHTSHINTSDAHNNTTGINLNLHNWIVDSGATDHICNSINFFTSYHAIPTIIINLPNGDTILLNFVAVFNYLSSWFWMKFF
jgi:hypothetical protein